MTCFLSYIIKALRLELGMGEWKEFINKTEIVVGLNMVVKNIKNKLTYLIHNFPKGLPNMR